MNSAKSAKTIAAPIQRQGCRSGTALIASAGGAGSTVFNVVMAHASADRSVDGRRLDLARLDAPSLADLVVRAVVHQRLQCLLQRLAKGRALRDRPSVGRRLEDLPGRLELATALLDGVRSHRGVRRHRSRPA